MNSRPAILILGLVLSPLTHADALHAIGPLTVEVLDARTEQPLRGITVHYFVLRETHWTVFPLTIEAHIKDVIVEPRTVHTNSDGVVILTDIYVPLESYWVQPKAQRIYSELLFINLEPPGIPPQYKQFYKDKYEYLLSTLPELEDLDRPNKHYLGYLLTTADISQAHSREHDLATAHFEPEQFREPKARRFVAKLKPAATDAQPALPADGPRPAGSGRR